MITINKIECSCPERHDSVSEQIFAEIKDRFPPCTVEAGILDDNQEEGICTPIYVGSSDSSQIYCKMEYLDNVSMHGQVCFFDLHDPKQIVGQLLRSKYCAMFDLLNGHMKTNYGIRIDALLYSMLSNNRDIFYVASPQTGDYESFIVEYDDKIAYMIINKVLRIAVWISKKRFLQIQYEGALTESTINGIVSRCLLGELDEEEITA